MTYLVVGWTEPLVPNVTNLSKTLPDPDLCTEGPSAGREGGQPINLFFSLIIYEVFQGQNAANDCASFSGRVNGFTSQFGPGPQRPCYVGLEPEVGTKKE